MLAPVVVAALVLCPPTPPLHRALVADGYVRVWLGTTRVTDIFVVRCRAGGHDLRLGLDTGAAPYTVLTPAAARRLGLKVRPVPDDPRHPDTGWGFVPDLTLGGAVTRGGPALVRPLPGGVGDGPGGLDGLIGHRCLSFYDAHIDYPTQALFLRPPGDADLARLFGDWECVSFEKDGTPTAPTAGIRRLRLCLTDRWGWFL